MTLTPQDIFDTMPERLDESAAKGISATIQYNLNGDDGGQWFVTIKGGAAEVGTGSVSSPNMTMSMTAADFVGINTGKLSPQVAFMDGKLKISGDVGFARKMNVLFKRPR